MSVITKGNVILFKNVCGCLIKHEGAEICEYPSNSIIYCENLSNELAISAVRSKVQGIITRKSSFSTHGANILRSGDYAIAWVTNVNIDILDLYDNEMIYINIRGEISDAYIETKDVQIQYSFEEIPRNDTSIIDLNLVNRDECICFWKYNYFTKFIFSSLGEGIKREFFYLYQYRPYVFRDVSGKIWIKTKLRHSSILEYCSDSYKLEQFLQRMQYMYNNILKKLNSKYISLELLQNCLIDYYSCFTMIHRSYENILYNFYSLLLKNFSGEKTIEIMNLLMTCKIDIWLEKEGENINYSKKFLIKEKVVSIPPFAIDEDIQLSISRIQRKFQEIEAIDWFDENEKSVLVAIKLFVLKEWKFVIYKLLTSRCYFWFLHRSEIPIDIVAEEYTYSEVINTYGDKKIYLKNE